jgi:histidinol dehydrogenase
MLAIPALAAGVSQLAVATPPRTGGEEPEVDPTVLALCGMLGIERVYRFHGAAVAALALGTESVEPVAMLAGPGNAYSQQAKRQLYGQVGVDGLFGPSEVVVWADAAADPAWVAADLLAQAEHNPGAAFAISTDAAVLARIESALEEQLASRSRSREIQEALRSWCALLLVADDGAATDLINRVAPEHLTLALSDPAAALPAIRHAGAIFLGDSSPVASGDYWAGPSHCLPTGRTARFSSGCSVYTFLKRSSLEAYPYGLPNQAILDIERLAMAEGFEAHAHSVRVRRPND